MLLTKNFQQEQNITIVITDSGLGGMAVCAGIEEQIKKSKTYKNARLIFFNALPERSKGYNSFPNSNVKARVFNQALISMEKIFKPDIILVACNTLSTVYSETEFSQKTKTPVLGMIKFGVSMILSELELNPLSEILILGTETTISSDAHKNLLIQNGVAENKIIVQSCPELETEIQRSSKSYEVKRIIKQCLQSALLKSQSQKIPIIAALCCTHYGFALNIFKSTFKRLSNRKITFINPNKSMIEFISRTSAGHENLNPNISVEVVSRSIIRNDEIQSITKLIKSFAPISSKALLDYNLNPNLFKFSLTE